VAKMSLFYFISYDDNVIQAVFLETFCGICLDG